MIELALYIIGSVVGVGIFVLIGTYSYKQIDIRKKTTSPSNTFIYKKNQEIIVNNLVKLPTCVTHESISEVHFYINKALSYFENKRLTVFDRPPEQVRRSINTYCKVILEQIYKLDDFSDEDLGIEIMPNEEIDTHEDYLDESPEQREARHTRRSKYKTQLRQNAILEFLYNKKSLEDYLDEQTLYKFRELKKIRAKTGDEVSLLDT